MIIDILCLASLSIGFWMGYSRGIVRTLFGILSLFFGLILAFMFSTTTTDLLVKVFGEGNPLISLLGFVLTFIGIMLLIRLLANGIEKLLEKIKLNLLNKVAGGVVLSMAFGVVFSIVLWFFDQAGVISADAKSASMTYPLIEDVPEATRQLFSKLKPLFQDFWNEASRLIEEMRKNANT